MKSLPFLTHIKATKQRKDFSLLIHSADAAFSDLDRYILKLFNPPFRYFLRTRIGKRARRIWKTIPGSDRVKRLIAILLIIPVLIQSFANFFVVPLPPGEDRWHMEKVANGAYILKDREPMHQTLADPSKKLDLNFKENQQAVAVSRSSYNVLGSKQESRNTKYVIPNTDEVYRWSVTLPSGTIFSFGKQETSGILPVVKVQNKEGWFVRYTSTQSRHYVKPVVKANVISWEISPGVTARYTMKADRVKADYIVTRKDALVDGTSLTFAVEHNSGHVDASTQSLDTVAKAIKEGKGEMTSQIMPNGDIAWLDQNNKEVFTFPSPVVEDSKKSKLPNTRYEIQNTGDNSGQSLLSIVLLPDQLNNAAFPLTIDPVTIDSAATTTGTAYNNGRKLLKDAWGNLLAFMDGGTGNDNVYYKNYNSNNWTDANIDLDSSAGSAAEIAADLDSSGSAHTVFRNTNSNAIQYKPLLVSRAGDNTISSIGTSTALSLDTTGTTVVTPSMIIANKGGGAAVEKIAASWNLESNVTRLETRFLQCNLTDNCLSAANWKNADGGQNAGGASTDGTAGIPSAANNSGAADDIFRDTGTSRLEYSVITQIPGKPKRSAGRVEKSLSSVFTNMPNAIDGSTGTTETINSLTTTDYVYVGDANMYSKATFDITNTNTNAATFTTLEYCSANSNTSTTCDTWTALSNTIDNTATATVAFNEDGSLMFDEPSNWIGSTEGSDTDVKYWVRIRPSAALDGSVSIAEVYVMDRNARSLLIVGGEGRTQDLRAAYVPWDEITNASWENRPDQSTNAWRQDAGAASSAFNSNGAEWASWGNFPLSTTIDYVNNRVYVVGESTTGLPADTKVYTMANNKDLTITANWTDAAFPAVTEASDMVFTLVSDRQDIYVFYTLDTGSTALTWRKCNPAGGGVASVCDNASDWGAEMTIDTTADSAFPQPLVSKAFGDTVAIDVIYTYQLTPSVVYERHFVDMGFATKTVSVSGDDSYHRDCSSGTDDLDIASASAKLGYEAADTQCVGNVASNNHAGFRFPAVNVPQGAKIASAYLDFRVNLKNSANSIPFTVYGEDANSSAAYAASTNCTDPCSGGVGARTRTSNSSSQNINFHTNSYRIDVTNIIQEIVCRGASDAQPCVGSFNGAGNWTPNGDISLLLISTGSTQAYVLITAQDAAGTAMLDPTLQINLGQTNYDYSMGSDVSLPTGAGSYLNFDHPMATTSGELAAVMADDNNFASISATTNASQSGVPAFMFKVNNTNNNNTDYITTQIIAKSNAPPSSRTLYLQVYRGGSKNDWVTIASNSTSAADTDVYLYASLPSKDYYQQQSGTQDQFWTYFRLYQDAPGAYQNETLSVDYVNTTFSSDKATSYWKFDEGTGTTTRDSMSTGRYGTLSGSTLPVWTSDQCMSQKCLFFNGVTSTVPVTGTVTGVKSIAFWVNPSASSTAEFMKLNTQSTSTHIRSTTGTVTAPGMTSPTIYVNGVVNGTVSANTWNYVTVTTSTAFSPSAVTFGQGPLGVLKGYLDEVKLFNFVLSSSQIQANYNALSSSRGSAGVLGAKDQSYLTKGLVGYWKMDETTQNTCSGGANDNCDSSGNGFDGAWNNNATASTSAKFGAGVDLDGTNDYVSVSHNSALEPTEELTYSAWVKFRSLSGGDIIMSKNDENAGSFRAKELVISDTTHIGFAVYNGTNNSFTATVPTMSSGNWYHIAVTVKDNQFVRLYFNGQLVGDTATNKDLLLTDNQPFTIGGVLNTGSLTQDLNGVVDEARVYKRALSAQEIEQLYNFAPGPVGYWKFDEKSGSTANDSSGYGVTGGSWAGSGSPWTRGKFGGGIALPGSSDGYLFNPPTNFTNPATGITVSAWVKVNQNKNWNDFVYRNGWLSSASWLLYSNSSGVISFGVYDGTTEFDAQSASNALVPGVWTHVTGVYDGTDVLLYVNGAFVARKTATGGRITFSSLTTLDLGSGAGANTVDGSLDEVRIYNYARTAKQVTEDMNASHPAGGSPVGSAIGYWKFDGGQGNVASNSGSLGSILSGKMLNFSSPPSNNSGWTNHGKFGKALNFDSSDDVVEMGSDSSIDDMATFSVSGWFNPRSAGESNAGTLFDKSIDAAGSSGWQVFFASSSRTVAFGVDYSGASDLLVITSEALPLNTWSHVMITWDGSSTAAGHVHIYINGKEATYSTQTNGVSSRNSDASGQFRVGNVIDRTFTFDGWMDEVKLYNYALSPSEVKVDYTRSSGLKFGVLGTNSDGTTASDSASRMYCPPGDTSTTCAPVGEWRFEGKTGNYTQDSSGNENDGFMGNGPKFVRGKVGSALEFTNGSTQYVLAGKRNIVNDITTKTITAWVYPYSLPTNNGQILSKCQAASCRWVFHLENTGRIQFVQDFDVTDSSWQTGTNILPLNTWSHVVLIYNRSSSSNSPTLYINGRQVSMSAFNGAASGTAVTDTTDDIMIGNNLAQNRAFPGIIDEARLYNYALSSAQVAWDYNRGKPVLQWKLDECQGSTVYDSSGNGLHGTITIGGNQETTVGACGTSSSAWGDGATGKYNSSIHLDGNDDYVTVADNSNLDFADEDFTLSGWFYTEDLASNQMFIAKKTDSATASTGYSLQHLQATGVTELEVSDGSDRILVTSNANVLTSNGWNHIVAVFKDGDATNSTIYVNGKPVKASTTGTFANVDSVANAIAFKVGEYGDGTRNFQGKADDIQVFRYALTAAQVRNLYNQSSAVRFGPSQGSP